MHFPFEMRVEAAWSGFDSFLSHISSPLPHHLQIKSPNLPKSSLYISKKEPGISNSFIYKSRGSGWWDARTKRSEGRHPALTVYLAGWIS